MAPTTYAEVVESDTDVAAFVAAHPADVNLYRLPQKMWVARQDGAIVAVLMLKTRPYVSLDLTLAEPKSRPFMRILRLWQMAEKWLVAHNVPIVCASVHNSLQHYQSLLRRLGFVEVGEEPNVYGVPVETIYAKRLTKESHDAHSPCEA